MQKKEANKSFFKYIKNQYKSWFSDNSDSSPIFSNQLFSKKVFPLISEKKKIFFSILSKGQDPDDFIQKNGKEKFLNLLDSSLIRKLLGSSGSSIPTSHGILFIFSEEVLISPPSSI